MPCAFHLRRVNARSPSVPSTAQIKSSRMRSQLALKTVVTVRSWKEAQQLLSSWRRPLAGHTCFDDIRGYQLLARVAHRSSCLDVKAPLLGRWLLSFDDLHVAASGINFFPLDVGLLPGPLGPVARGQPLPFKRLADDMVISWGALRLDDGVSLPAVDSTTHCIQASIRLGRAADLLPIPAAQISLVMSVISLLFSTFFLLFSE